ncbi:MAG TPA: VWA domain-containing protein [Candidatus Dormibacteraeota bacterium]|nr:VWA domain-containing protein [Candidatus Dormibacteraeota bacterium]
MEFLLPLAGLALLTVPAIVLLYFLKVRRPEVRVSTLMFWRPYVADRQANAPWQRLRPSALLFLQLLAALVLALGLMRPGLIGAAGVDSTTVVMIDASPSMEATDVSPSRFGTAVEHARQLAGQLAPGQQMAVILLGDHAQLLAAPTGDSALLRSALDRARPSGTAGDFAEAISLANSILSGRPGGSIILLSDGHSRPPTSPPRVSAPFTYVSIGGTGENAAIQTMSRSGNGSVFLRLANYGRQTRDLKVEMRADGRLVDVLPAKLEGNTTADLTWSRLPSSTQVLEARLTPGDALGLDDATWLVIAEPPHHPVLLVTSENGFLQRALKLRPGLDVTTVKPADYKPGKYDLVIFDGFVPGGKLPEPALLVNPPAAQGPVPVGGQIDPGAVLPGDPRDPLLRDVSLKDVHVQSAAAVKSASGWRTVISAAADPLLLVREGDPRDALLTFDLHHSDLPLRAAFPILVQNLLDYLLPGGFENQVFAPGQAVTLIAEPDAKYADVSAPDGHTTRLTPPFSPFTATDLPGVYTVRQQLASGSRVSRFVVRLQDQSISRIAPGAAPLIQEADRQRGALPRGTLEIWPWLVAAALLALVVEWFVYLRGGNPLRPWGLFTRAGAKDRAER